MSEDEERKGSVFERHAQTALVTLIVLLLAWVANTTQNTAVAVAELRLEVAYLKDSIGACPAAHDTMYEALDAIRRRIEQLERVR